MYFVVVVAESFRPPFPHERLWNNYLMTLLVALLMYICISRWIFLVAKGLTVYHITLLLLPAPDLYGIIGRYNSNNLAFPSQ